MNYYYIMVIRDSKKENKNSRRIQVCWTGQMASSENCTTGKDKTKGARVRSYSSADAVGAEEDLDLVESNLMSCTKEVLICLNMPLRIHSTRWSI